MNKTKRIYKNLEQLNYPKDLSLLNYGDFFSQKFNSIVKTIFVKECTTIKLEKDNIDKIYQPLCEYISSFPSFKHYNHVRLEQFDPGRGYQKYIESHKDIDSSIIKILIQGDSLPILFTEFDKDLKKQIEYPLLLKSNEILLIKDYARYNYVHEIEKKTRDMILNKKDQSIKKKRITTILMTLYHQFDQPKTINYCMNYKCNTIICDNHDPNVIYFKHPYPLKLSKIQKQALKKKL